MMFDSARRSDTTIEPWAVVRWASAELVLFWLLTLAAASNLGGFGVLPFLVLGPVYIGLCVAIISGGAALQIARAHTRVVPRWWPVAATLIAQGVFVTNVWHGFVLPVAVSSLVDWVALGSLPIVAVIHIGLASRSHNAQGE